MPAAGGGIDKQTVGCHAAAVRQGLHRSVMLPEPVAAVNWEGELSQVRDQGATRDIFICWPASFTA